MLCPPFQTIIQRQGRKDGKQDKEIWTCLETRVNFNFHSPEYKQSSSTASGNQTQITSSGRIQRKPPGFCQISTSQVGQLRTARMPGKLPFCVSPKEAKISKDKDRRPTKHCKSSFISIPPLSIESYLYFLQTSHDFLWVLHWKTPHDTCLYQQNMP